MGIEHAREHVKIFLVVGDLHLRWKGGISVLLRIEDPKTRDRCSAFPDCVVVAAVDEWWSHRWNSGRNRSRACGSRRRQELDLGWLTGCPSGPDQNAEQRIC